MRLTLEALDHVRDLPLLHAWVTHPRSVFWGMQDATPEQVHDEYARIDADPHHHALLGRADGEPAFLVERYDPAHSPLAGLPELRAGDVGMHVLVAPTDAPVHGFTATVMRRVMEECFADPAVWSNSATTTEVGLNWYWNDYVKFYMTWLHADFGDPVQFAPGRFQDSADMFWLRGQLYF